MRFGGSLSPAVKALLIANFSVFILQQIMLLVFPIAPGIPQSFMEVFFGLSHNGFVAHHFVWQIFTYMFLHGGWLHIFFNMFTLWMFAGDLEQAWGSRRFVLYYLVSGLGAGIFIALMNWYGVTRDPSTGIVSTLGASGALYALLLAYGLLWPERKVLIWFLFPVKMKYVVIFFGLFEFFGTLNSMAGLQGNISHIGHLGGLFTGFIILKISAIINRPSTRKLPSSWYITKVLRSIRLRKKRKAIDTRIKAKETIDILLDKIAQQGMSSLTVAERKDLEWARRHYYPSDDEMIH